MSQPKNAFVNAPTTLKVCANDKCGNKFYPQPWHKRYCKRDCQQAKYHGQTSDKGN